MMIKSEKDLSKFKDGLIPFAVYNSMEGYNVDLVKGFEKAADITIIHPLGANAEGTRIAFQELAKDLSKDKKVFLYEASIEAGGGGSVELTKFIYEHFQPIIVISTSIALNIFSSWLYDLIKKIYTKRSHKIVESQFTIRRVFNGVNYNYVFDRLTADQALCASQLIPNDIENIKDSESAYYDIHLRYIPEKNVWVTFEI